MGKMESGKNAETLEDAFLELKLSESEIFCRKAREDGNLGFLCNLNEKCVIDASSGGNELSNLVLARKLGNGSVEESVVGGFAGDNRMSNGNDFPVFKGESKFRGNDGDHTRKAEESVGKINDATHCHELVNDVKFDLPMEKSNDVLHPHEPGSPTKIEVSGDSINLFVEVFGPLDGVSDDNLERELGENDLKQESSLKESGTVSAGVTDLSAKCEEKDIDGEQECRFGIGDVVWVKTRKQLWWPCVVSDPSTAPKDIEKSERRSSYLAKLYGSAKFVWCGNAELKPFVEYFEQMSEQNNSNNFIASVERAVCDIGLRVQLSMTCPCFSKDSQTLDARWFLRNEEENTMTDAVSLSQFQPATFIADIKNLARSIHAPSKVEFVVMRNRLSPFYRSVGHLELPLQMLGENHTNTSGDSRNSVEGNAGNLKVTRKYKKRKNCNVLDDNVTSSDNGSESRERKKSRYLSYPYVDVVEGQAKEGLKQSEGSCSGMDSQKKGTKKYLKDRHIVRKEDDIDASSVDLLAELRSSALDCFYISRSKYSDSLKRFYRSFRVFTFLDADVADKVAEERMKGTKSVKKSKKQKANPSAPINESADNVEGEKFSVTGDQKTNENVVRKRGRKKKEKVTNSQEQMVGITVGEESENRKLNLESGNPQAREDGLCMKPTNSVPEGFEALLNSSYMGTTVYPKSPWMISFNQASSYLFKSSKSPKKSNGSTPELANTKSTPKLPDLNGSLPGEHVEVEGLSTNPAVNPLPEPKKEVLGYPTVNSVHQSGFVPVPSSTDVPSTFQNTPLSNYGVTAVPYQGLNGGLSSYIPHPFQMGSFLSTGTPVPRKRKRREKTSEVASGIPDLNGNITDTSPLGTTAPEGTQIPPEGETQKKRRNRYDSSDSGGNIVLNFAVGSVPSRETLVATFSRFGLLKESELDILSDDGSVKIAYERSSEARFAFRSLEKGHPFGESLLNFNLDGCMLETPKIGKKNNLPLHTFVAVAPDSPKNRAKVGEKPDIAFIRKNVEMMKSTLEKAGDRLSPETRAKLENEIKALLDKIGSMAASSSYV